VSTEAELLEDSAEALFEDAPCGYVSTLPDGTIVKVNRTFEAWTGFARDELVHRRRFADLLTAGGRIYHETHYAPLLQMQGSVREIAVEVVRADGSRMPALVNSVLRRDAEGVPRVVRTTIFDATERRRYEQEILAARRRERDSARQLQRSLLAGRFPAPDGVAIDVAYRSADDGLEVGGDWYDAFWVAEGEAIALVVGDVVGRGIEAAATMGQLRSAVRALAATQAGPARVLTALDAFADRHRIGRMTTVVYAELECASRRLTWACAGHPPPALLAPGRPPELLWGGRSAPLDVSNGLTERPQAEAELPAGATIVLYTDGLVERRGRSLTEGLDVLLSELAGAPSPARLLKTLRDPAHPDDVCVLAAALRQAAADGAR